MHRPPQVRFSLCCRSGFQNRLTILTHIVLWNSTGHICLVLGCKDRRVVEPKQKFGSYDSWFLLRFYDKPEQNLQLKDLFSVYGADRVAGSWPVLFVEPYTSGFLRTVHRAVHRRCAMICAIESERGTSAFGSCFASYSRLKSADSPMPLMRLLQGPVIPSKQAMQRYWVRFADLNARCLRVTRTVLRR